MPSRVTAPSDGATDCHDPPRRRRPIRATAWLVVLALTLALVRSVVATAAPVAITGLSASGVIPAVLPPATTAPAALTAAVERSLLYCLPRQLLVETARQALAHPEPPPPPVPPPAPLELAGDAAGPPAACPPAPTGPSQRTANGLRSVRCPTGPPAPFL